MYCIISENRPNRVQEMRVEVTDVSHKNFVYQTSGKMPSGENRLCNFWLKVTMDESTKRWWLIYEHNDHPILHPEERLAGE